MKAEAMFCTKTKFKLYSKFENKSKFLFNIGNVVTIEQIGDSLLFILHQGCLKSLCLTIYSYKKVFDLFIKFFINFLFQKPFFFLKRLKIYLSFLL